MNKKDFIKMDIQKLNNALQNVLKEIYIEIHAIYESDGSDFLGDCYTAAVDLFSWKFTFRIWFQIDDDGSIKVENVERWHFG